MILNLYECAIRVRCAFLLTVAAAITLMTLNELSYQSSHQTLRNGIALTNARITSQRTLSPSELHSANWQRRAKPPSG